MTYVKEVTVTNFYKCMCLYISSLIQSAYFLSLIEIVSILSKQFNVLRHIFCCNMCFPTRYSNADMGAGVSLFTDKNRQEQTRTDRNRQEAFFMINYV